MIYTIIVLDKAKEDIGFLKKSEILAYNKINKMFQELREHPRIGTGKPELMKYGKYNGLWSRRITDKNRLVYSIEDDEIIVSVISVKGHYGDK